jgi:hypothetical protein
LLALLLVAGAGAVASCKPKAAAPVEEVTLWQGRGVWKGRGSTQTDPFTSGTGLLRLTWETHGASVPDAGTFKIILHSDVSGRPLLVAVDRRGSAHDVTYVTEDPRAFFLVIESEGLDWSVDVAEGLPATKTLPRPSAR